MMYAILPTLCSKPACPIHTWRRRSSSSCSKCAHQTLRKSLSSLSSFSCLNLQQRTFAFKGRRHPRRTMRACRLVQSDGHTIGDQPPIRRSESGERVPFGVWTLVLSFSSTSSPAIHRKRLTRYYLRHR
jgi:hypothetical protein